MIADTSKLMQRPDTLQKKELDAIKKQCFINAPWQKLKDTYLDLFLQHGLQPEIGLEGNCLYDEKNTEFQRVATLLRKSDLNCTLHAPFFDLAPGAFDPYILEQTRIKLNRAFSLLKIFKPRSIVCHLMFEENKHGYVYKKWLEVNVQTWAPLLALAERENVPVMFENTYEKSPTVHLELLKRLNSPYAQFCLDVGHLMAFSKTNFQDWLPDLTPWLGQLHLHDNHGEKDDHLAPGRGGFDFVELFKYLRKNLLSPIVTFEPHSEDDLWATFDYLLTTRLLT